VTVHSGLWFAPFPAGCSARGFNGGGVSSWLSGAADTTAGGEAELLGEGGSLPHNRFVHNNSGISCQDKGRRPESVLSLHKGIPPADIQHSGQHDLS
jgi:hypothetical protein